MKTETRTYTLYQTTELSEESKERVLRHFDGKSDEERLTQQEPELLNSSYKCDSLHIQ